MVFQPINAQVKKEIQWIGGPTFILQLGSFKILADPILGCKSKEAFYIKKHPVTGELNAPIERYSDPAPFDYSNIDILLISHLHPDHIDENSIKSLNKSIKTITATLGGAQLNSWGLKNTEELEWNQVTTLKKGEEKIKIIAVKAMHAETEPLNSELGKVNGYIIEHSSGQQIFRVYWTGDTVWFDGIEKIKGFGKIDLLIPNMGAVGNGKRGLNASACIQIANTLHPHRIIPVHHTTFSHYTEPIIVLKEMIKKTKFKKSFTIIDLGTVTKL